MIPKIVYTVVIINLIFIVYYLFKKTFGYWSKQKIPTSSQLPINQWLKLKTNIGIYLQKTYKEEGNRNEKVVGIYAGFQPALMIKDMQIIEEIMLSDYENTAKSTDDHDYMTSMTMFRFHAQKDKHKKVSKIISEQSLMKMYPIMEKVAKDLENYLLEKSDSFVADVNDMVLLYTSDITGNLVYGASSNCLKITNEDLYHREVIRKLKYSWFRLWKFYMINFNSSNKGTQYIKMFDGDFKILRLSTEYVICERERRKVKRNDIIQELIKIRKEAKSKGEYTTEEHNTILGITTSLYATLFDASYTLTYALYELAKHPKVQLQLREEMQQALRTSNGCLTYETLNSLNYLDMVINEILRLYPLYPFIYRKCSKYSHPSVYEHLWENYNYKPLNGMPIFIPIYALHHDAKLWPNPTQFDPDRFSNKNKSNIRDMSYMPLGNNPYDCFGSHFVVLTLKLGLFNFLKNHSVRVCKKTVEKLKFDPNSPTLTLKDTLYLEFVKDVLFNKDS